MPPASTVTDNVPLTCPCESGLMFENCCQQVIVGAVTAKTAEALMRSRYTAYVVRDSAYLLATWHPSTRPSDLNLDPEQRWLGLKIMPEQTAGVETHCQVEFIARYKIAGRAHRMHERSRFICENGTWFYLDGEFPSAN